MRLVLPDAVFVCFSLNCFQSHSVFCFVFLFKKKTTAHITKWLLSTALSLSFSGEILHVNPFVLVRNSPSNKAPVWFSDRLHCEIQNTNQNHRCAQRELVIKQSSHYHTIESWATLSGNCSTTIPHSRSGLFCGKKKCKIIFQFQLEVGSHTRPPACTHTCTSAKLNCEQKWRRPRQRQSSKVPFHFSVSASWSSWTPTRRVWHYWLQSPGLNPLVRDLTAGLLGRDPPTRSVQDSHALADPSGALTSLLTSLAPSFTAFTEWWDTAAWQHTAEKMQLNFSLLFEWLSLFSFLSVYHAVSVG